MAEPTDSAYFTLPELRAAFRLVTNDSMAGRMVEIWRTLFSNCVVGDQVVELPSDYELPRLGGSNDPGDIACDDQPGQVDQYFDEMNSGIGVHLIRFSGLLFDLLAGASPEVRARFERMGVPFAYGTLDNPMLWRSLLDFIRRDG